MGKKILSPSFLILILVTVGLGILSIFTGVYDINEDLRMIFITRIPRTLALMLTGLAMTMSGLVMQLLSQNKFVEPTTTGTIQWAGFGIIASFIIFKAPSLLEKMSFAIIFSFIGSMIFFLFLSKIKLKSSLIVPIVGIMFGAVISSVSNFISLVFKQSQSLESYFQGSFSSVEKGRYEYLFLIVIISILIFILADRLTIVGLGKDVSTNLGLNYNKLLLIGTSLISLCVGIVAAVIGNLPFLGLIVPNLVSIFRGDDLRSNLLWVGLVGMSTITLADILSRTIISPFELPVSLILGSFGSIIFIGLILYKRRQNG